MNINITATHIKCKSCNSTKLFFAFVNEWGNYYKTCYRCRSKKWFENEDVKKPSGIINEVKENLPVIMDSKKEEDTLINYNDFTPKEIF